MTIDFPTIIGYLVESYFTGWISGFLWFTVRRFLDFI